MFRYTPSLSNVLAATLIASASAFVEPAQAASKRDYNACNKGTGDTAIRGCTRIINDKRESARNRAVASYNRGLHYSRKGDLDRAMADYNVAILYDRGFAAPYLTRGNIYKGRGDLERAIADYSEAIRLNPKFAVAYNNRGNTYYDKRDYRRAIADYNEAIRIDRKYAAAYSNRGAAYKASGDVKRAIADFDKAIQINPRYAAAYYNRYLSRRARGDRERARADLEKAAQLGDRKAITELREGPVPGDTRVTGRPVKGKPGKHVSCHYMANSAAHAFKNKHYQRARDGYTRAIEWMKKTCDATPDDLFLFDHYKGRAEASALMGDYEQAARDIATLMKTTLGAHRIDNDFEWMTKALDAAIKRQPRNASFYGARADIHSARAFDYDFRKKDKDRAKAAEKLALADRNAQVKFARTKAERAEALADRHFVYKGLKEPKLALADIDTAIELDPKADYYRRRAFFYKGQKDPASMIQALGDISRAIEMEPKRHWYYKMRTEIYQEMGNTDGAIDSLTQAMAMLSPRAPGHTEYLRDRALLFKKKGKLNEAAKDYAELIKLHPKSARWRSERMLLLLEQGKDAQAEAERKQIEELEKKAAAGKRVLESRAFVCNATDIYDRRRTTARKTTATTDLRKAWNMGQVAALVPLRHLIGKQDAKTKKAWAALSKLVQDAQASAGGQARGLDAVPEFKGAKAEQLRQAIAFVFDQLKTTENAVTRRLGEQAGALFALSAAGHMAEVLNRMGVPILNARLGGLIARRGPQSGVPCGTWVETMLKAASNAERAEVVAAWTEARKAFKEANAR